MQHPLKTMTRSALTRWTSGHNSVSVVILESNITTRRHLGAFSFALATSINATRQSREHERAVHVAAP